MDGKGEGPWGAEGIFRMPCFVVIHRERPQLVKGPTTFTFVTEGPRCAVERARVAAGDRDVIVVGGPDVARQSLANGLIDEIRLHLVTVLLGVGTRLFEGTGAPIDLERIALVESPLATPFTFRVIASSA